MRDSPSIPFSDGGGVIHKILQVVGRRQIAGLWIGPRPGRRIAQAHQQTQPMRGRPLDNAVIFRPVKLPAPRHFQVFPRKFLPQPDKPGLAYHPQHGLDFFGFDLLLQKGIDAVRNIGFVIDGRQRSGVKRLTDEIAGDLNHAADLRQRPFFAGLRPKPVPQQAAIAQIQAGQRQSQQQRRPDEHQPSSANFE